MDTSKDKVIRVRRSQTEIRKHLEAFKASGMSQQAFCRKHNLSVASFSNWRRKAEQATSPISGFRPVRLNEPLVAASVSVRLPDGIELFFEQGNRAREVAALINALQEHRSC